MAWFNTRAVILTAGIGMGSTEIVAFDSALRSASIADFNLIRVTSIVPPHVPVYKMASEAEPISGLGHMLPTVYAHESSIVDGDLLTTCVGVGVPEDDTKSGVIFPNSGTGLKEDECIEGLESMIAEAMVELRRSDSYVYRYAVASTTAQANAKWHCALSALCFVDDELWPYFEGKVRLLTG
jgi:arginine decarboxylase